MAPMNRVLCASVKGVQVSPASAVFQTPPPAAARKMVLESTGSAASAATRPDVGSVKPLENSTVGAGPIGVHVDGSSGIESVVALDRGDWAPRTAINTAITAVRPVVRFMTASASGWALGRRF